MVQRNTNYLKGLLFTTGIAAVLAFALEVKAQDTDTEEESGVARGLERVPMERVVVTARKREETLLDFPGSAAVLGQTQIADLGGVRNLRDVTDQIVGLTITEAVSSDLAEPSIRGAGQSRNRTSPSATGLYRDGAYFASFGLGGRNFARFDSFDLQRVEILRGPQGALYGRNSLGGTINLITQRPTDEFEFSALGAIGSKDRFLFEGIVNIPLTDKLAVRLNGVYDEQDDGFFRSMDGSPLDILNYKSYRVGVRYDITDDLQAYYSYDYSDDRFAPTLRSRNSIIEQRRANGEDVDQFDTMVNTDHFATHEIENHHLGLDWDLGHGTVSSITNYRERELVRTEDLDFAGPSLAAASRMRANLTVTTADVFFQELRYVSDFEGPFQFLLGADLYTLNSSEDIRQTLNPLQLDEVRCGQQIDANFLACRDIDIEQNSWAIYGSADYTFDFVPVTLTGEIRYAFDEVEGTVLLLRRNVAEPILDFAGGNEFTNLPWGVTAAWRLENSQIYGKVATSYRHGGINLNASLPSDAFQSSPVYDEETAITYELGYKRELFGFLNLTAAAYFVQYEDLLDTASNGCPELCPFLDPDTAEPLGFDADGNRIEVDPDGNPGDPSPTVNFIENVGTAEAYGFEIELAGTVPIDWTGGSLRLGLGVAAQDGEVTEIFDNVSGGNQDSLGQRLPRLRDLQISANSTYRHPVSLFNGPAFDEASFFFTWSLVYEKGGVQNISSVIVNPLDSFTRLDMRLGIDTAYWTIAGSFDNLTDTEYNLNVASNGDLVNPALPRRFLVEFIARY